MSRSTRWGVALLVVGMAIGVGGAQAWQLLGKQQFLNTGLFTLGKGETAFFNVTLDDDAGQPSANVIMQLFDRRGGIVARQAVVLAPGQSATLRHDIPGVYRAHAEIESPDVKFSNRRRLLTTLEIHGDPLGGLAFPRIYVCSSSSDDGAGSGRIPDEH